MGLPLDKSAMRRYVERSIQELPPLPAAVTKILDLTSSPDATASDLDKIISTEPAVTAKLLRVVNSAYYGLSGQVTTTSHAILVLGFHQIRNMMLAMGALSLLKSQTRSDANLQLALWRHSFGAAAASEWIASDRELLSEDRSLAYVSALLHDIGALLLLAYFPDLYRTAIMWANEHDATLEAAETHIVGLDHAEVGAMLTHAWRFPAGITDAILTHHTPPSPSADPIGAVLHASDYVATMCGYSIVPNGTFQIEPEIALWCGYTEAIPEELLGHVRSRVLAAEGFYDIL
jgi:putative nucleotidyltransferase with HDIG domain